MKNSENVTEVTVMPLVSQENETTNKVQVSLTQWVRKFDKHQNKVCDFVQTEYTFATTYKGKLKLAPLGLQIGQRITQIYAMQQKMDSMNGAKRSLKIASKGNWNCEIEVANKEGKLETVEVLKFVIKENIFESDKLAPLLEVFFDYTDLAKAPILLE